MTSQGMQEPYSDIQDYRKMQPLNWSSSLNLDSVAGAAEDRRYLEFVVQIKIQFQAAEISPRPKCTILLAFQNLNDLLHFS